ncbi:MAG: hypothetical protein C0394_00285 [Syntrophus sp. (in: bacteria)]|nr:hypothetical protein [Syntrophus sp. (in: bacteria)]
MFSILLFVPAFSGCETYRQQVVPFKLPTAYPNVVTVADAQIAAQAYDDPKEAQEAFGFDIRGAGILPVKVVFDNTGANTLEIETSQTFLVDADNNLWPILDQNMAYDRISKKTELGKVVPEAAKGALLAGAAGAIIGAAVGIVTGRGIGEAIGKGAAVGAAAGATIGGTRGLSDRDVQVQIRDDLDTRSLKKRAIPPRQVAHGFIFFPGEAKNAKEIRLFLRATNTGKTYPLSLKF